MKTARCKNVAGTAPGSVDEHQVQGIDLGLKDFATLSDGRSTVKVPNPRFRRQGQRKVAKAQRHLSRCAAGSKNREKAKLRLAQTHSRLANRQNEFIHQFTKALGESQARVIVLETLSVKNMLKNRKLARSVSDAALSEFTRFLTYKMERFGKAVVFIDRFYPSSKLC